MRHWAFGVAMLCGCYAPQPPRGAPCDEQRPCPTGQSCIAGFCGGVIGMTDGPKPMGDSGSLPPDMSSNTDVDGDGIANTMDNCPMFSNPAQGNEDGDMLGDPCDPCPIDAANPPSDPDMDGVSDSCDPNPTAAGDSLTVFEGFHNGVPANWQNIGNAMQAGDDLNLSANAEGAVVPPPMAPANGTVTMRAKINQTLGNFDSTLAVVMPYDAGGQQGIFCELYAPNAGSSSGRTLDLYKPPDTGPFAGKAYGWQTNTYYTLKLKKTGTTYNCSATPMGGATDTVNGNSGLALANAKAGAFLYGANINISWLMVVTSN